MRGFSVRRRGWARRLAWTVVLSIGTATGMAISFPAASFERTNEAQLAQTAQQRRFDIAAQPLADALAQFGQQSGIQVTVHGDIVRGLTAQRVIGTMTPEQALTQLLAGTGITHRRTDANTITLAKIGSDDPSVTVLDPITVEGQGESAYGPVPGIVATRSATGTKSDAPLIETPQSVSVVGGEQMEQQNVQSIAQALRYTAGIVAEQRGVNTDSLEYIYGRGFQIDTYMNGLLMPNAGSGFKIVGVDPYFLERVEYLHGPASVLYGQASPGGLVNLVSKRPPTEPIHEVLLQTGNRWRAQGAFDLGGPVMEDSNFYYRLVANAFRTDSQVEHNKQERIAIAPSLTWRPTSDTALTLLFTYQRDPDAGYYNLTPAQGMVLPNVVELPRDFDPGQPNWDRYRKEAYSAGYEFEHRFNPVWTVKQNFRYMYTSNYIRGLFADEGLTPDGLSLQRYSYINDGNFHNLLLDSQIHSHFNLGITEHFALAGFDYQRTYESHIFTANFGAPPISIVNPDYNQVIPEPDFVFGSSTRSDVDQVGLYLQDRIKAGNWTFLLGGRLDSVSTDITNLKFGNKTHQNDSAFSPRAGVVYQFDLGIAPYFSYSESFQPAIGSDVNGNAFEPTTGRQFEIGVKFQPPGLNSFITASLFNLKRQNVLTPDPNNTGFSVQTGEITVNGAEIEAHASVTEEIDIIGAYTYTDAEVTKSNSTNLHKEPTGIPHHMVSAWLNYRFPLPALRGLQAGFGVRYVGPTQGDTTNTFEVPAFTLFDASIRYDLAGLSDSLTGWRTGVSVSNLLDETYVASCIGINDCAYGVGRVILASVRYRW